MAAVIIRFGYFTVFPRLDFLNHPIGVAGLSIGHHRKRPLRRYAFRHCEEHSDEAIQLFTCGFWIASRSLSSGAHARDPLAPNDGTAKKLIPHPEERRLRRVSKDEMYILMVRDGARAPPHHEA
jgi:hypothetical protein